MASVGILVHGRHLEARGWHDLAWGVPEKDSLGSLPKTVNLLLHEAKSEPVEIIVFGNGPSIVNGLSEGEYGKQYLFDRLGKLRQFPSLRAILDDAALVQLKKRLEGIVMVAPRTTRSIDEIATAARLFEKHGVTKVWQVTAASHAPRCMQIQSAARAQRLIPQTQQWFLVADDRCYEGADPFSTLIMEVPHRGDDPMMGQSPSLPELMKQYQYGLSPEDKHELATLVEQFFAEHGIHSEVRNFR